MPPSEAPLQDRCSQRRSAAVLLREVRTDAAGAVPRAPQGTCKTSAGSGKKSPESMLWMCDRPKWKRISRGALGLRLAGFVDDSSLGAAVIGCFRAAWSNVTVVVGRGLPAGLDGSVMDMFSDFSPLRSWHKELTQMHSDANSTSQ